MATFNSGGSEVGKEQKNPCKRPQEYINSVRYKWMSHFHCTASIKKKKKNYERYTSLPRTALVLVPEICPLSEVCLCPCLWAIASSFRYCYWVNTGRLEEPHYKSSAKTHENILQITLTSIHQARSHSVQSAWQGPGTPGSTDHRTICSRTLMSEGNWSPFPLICMKK